MYRKPWERQVNESGPAFYAFAVYRDQGHTRSLRSVAERLASEVDRDGNIAAGGDSGPTEGGFRLIVRPKGWSPDDPATIRQRKRVPGKITGWSTQWAWVDRARAWDKEIERYVRAAHLDEIKKMSKRQAQEAQACAAVAMTFVGQFLTRMRDPEDQERMKRVPIEELGMVALEATGKVSELHEAERNARCIRSRNMLSEDGTVTTEWEIFERVAPKEESEHKEDEEIEV